MSFYTCNVYGREYYIPDRVGGGIKRYIAEGIEPGRFLTAIICNNLHDAFSQADDENFQNIAAYIHYFYNKTPLACWKSRELMDAWMKQHQKRRKENAEQPT